MLNNSPPGPFPTCGLFDLQIFLITLLIYLKNKCISCIYVSLNSLNGIPRKYDVVLIDKTL